MLRERGGQLLSATWPSRSPPRSFEGEPDGRFVLGAGEGSGKRAVCRVDPDTGPLTRRHTYDGGKSLTWVTAIKLGDQ